MRGINEHKLYYNRFPSVSMQVPMQLPSHLTTTSAEDAKPPCPQCGAKMQFVSVSIYDDDRDRRVFECKPCLRSETCIVNVS